MSKNVWRLARRALRVAWRVLFLVGMAIGPNAPPPPPPPPQEISAVDEGDRGGEEEGLE